MGAVAGCPITAIFDGDASLRKRPMRRVVEPVELIGAHAVSVTDGGRLPITLAGARDPMPVVYRTPVPSAQIKSAVLLAGLAAPGETTVIESEASRDHTERLLAHFGADVRVADEDTGRWIRLKGQPELVPAPVMVPADPLFRRVPHGGGPDSARFRPRAHRGDDQSAAHRAHADLARDGCRHRGARERRAERGEEMADLRVRASALRGVEVPAERAPSMIDEYPILAVAASFAEGTTVMRGLKELRVKESDRLAAVADGLRVNGADVEIEGDDLIVHGRARPLGGATVTTHMDHRIAMAFLVMGLASEKPVGVDDASIIAAGFPAFPALMRAAGADLG